MSVPVAKTTYKNPIMLSDYSDPDVIRVGDTYYMTASSFHFTPGLPLLMSHDLVQWNLVGYAASTISLSQFDRPQHSKGIWAPALRYHNGKFIIVVGLPDEGIFVTESADFTGEWTPLRCVREAKGFIDPCPLWDDDGKAYIVHAYAKSRIGFKSRLGIFEVDPQTLDAISEDSFIFFGEETQPTIEGPKVYKRNGLYYILAPAGGVKQGWQTALRSSSIFGPFEERIVLAQGSTHINGPHQGALIDTPAGEHFFLHFQDRGIYGRVIALQPAGWTSDGWPCMGTGVKTLSLPGEPVDSALYPAVSEKAPLSADALPGVSAVAASDSFAQGKPALQWQWQANARPEDYVSAAAPCGIQLYAQGNGTPLWDYPGVLSEKIVYEQFESVFDMDVSALKTGERAGVIFLGGQYAALELFRTESGALEARYLESATAACDAERRIEKVCARCAVPESAALSGTQHFSMRFLSKPPAQALVEAHTCDSERPSSGECVFSLKAGDFVWQPDVSPYATDGDHWVGGKIGMYAQGDGGSVIIKKVIVTPIEC